MWRVEAPSLSPQEPIDTGNCTALEHINLFQADLRGLYFLFFFALYSLYFATGAFNRFAAR